MQNYSAKMTDFVEFLKLYDYSLFNIYQGGMVTILTLIGLRGCIALRSTKIKTKAREKFHRISFSVILINITYRLHTLNKQ